MRLAKRVYAELDRPESPKQSLVLLNGFERWLESLSRIAAEHGFSSPTRFAQSFRRKYDVCPSEMLRDRYDTLAG